MLLDYLPILLIQIGLIVFVCIVKFPFAFGLEVEARTLVDILQASTFWFMDPLKQREQYFIEELN